MKVQTDKNGAKKYSSKSEDDEEEDDDDEVAAEELRLLTDSRDWEVARTIYSTIQLRGRVAIDKVDDTTSNLVMEFKNFDIAKLDIHKGHPDDKMNADIINRQADDDDEDDDDFEDEDKNDDKTHEGGLI